jgi:hypothetical protein
VDNLWTTGTGRARVSAELPNSFEEYHFSGISVSGELEHRAIPPTSSTDEWLISAIIFLWTEAGTPGKQVKPDVTGRKRRLYGLNYITNTCKNRGYLRCFMGSL